MRVVPHRSPLFDSALRSLFVMLAVRDDIPVEGFRATPEAVAFVDGLLELRSVMSSRAGDGLYGSKELNRSIQTIYGIGETYYGDDKASFLSFIYGTEYPVGKKPSCCECADGHSAGFRHSPGMECSEETMRTVAQTMFGREGDVFSPGFSNQHRAPKTKWDDPDRAGF